MNAVILVINSGSSSIKFALFDFKQALHLRYQGEIEDLAATPCLTVFNADHQSVVKQNLTASGHEAALRAFFVWFEGHEDAMTLTAVGHRVVHGGQYFLQPTLVTDEVMMQMASLIPLAPLHQPHCLAAINIIKQIYPALPQVACFDTTFHQTREKVATLFAIPRALTEAGVIRYGFHGISYEYIASVLTQQLGDIGNQRVIVAHLGNGASLCALYQRKSVATTMGLTVLDGLMMGSRCGQIDPGVLLYLLQEKHYTVKQLEHLLYSESGLLGVSGLSHDVRALLAREDVDSKAALGLFCYYAALQFGALAVALNGCDAIVFTAGIGEHAPLIRQQIAEYLAFLGVKIDHAANRKNATIISEQSSRICVAVIPTNEEYIVAQHTWRLLN